MRTPFVLPSSATEESHLGNLGLVLLAAVEKAGLLISPAFAYHGGSGGPIPIEAIWPFIILGIAVICFLVFLGKKRDKKRKKRKRF